MKRIKPLGTRTTEYLLGTKPEKGFDGEVQKCLPNASSPPGTAFISRLSWNGTPVVPNDPEALAQTVNCAEDRVLYYCDSSLFDRETDCRVWEALLSRRAKIVIVPHVLRELQPWLAANPDHIAAKAVTGKASAIRFLDLNRLSSSQISVREYYCNLLLIRKKAVNFYKMRFEDEHGRPPDQAELKALREQIHNKDIGPRGYMLAKKGEQAAGSANYCTDEVVVSEAVISGVEESREAVILTKDEDLQEQTYKLGYLLDTHYRSMLFASYYLGRLADFQSFPIPADIKMVSDAFDVSTGHLVQRSQDMFENVLPSKFETIPFHCWLVGREFSQLTFAAETPMRRLIDVKGETRGLNTNVLGGLNCHIWLAPLPLPMHLRGTAAIVADRRVECATAQIPLLDINQSLNCQERFKRIVFAN